MTKLLLIDGNSLVFRAYHATMKSRPMTTSNGIPTNAVFAFIHMIQRSMKMFAPDEVLVAFDAGGPTFRHEMYPDYKGNRKPADDELKAQFPIVREYLDAAGICRYELPGYEADDLVGTMVETHPDDDIAVLTGDRDLLQLIRPNATVYLMLKGTSEMIPFDQERLKQEYDLDSPQQVIEIKGLEGDSSDNYKGIPGIGSKTAHLLLKKYGTVEGVLAHADELKGKQRENVEAGKESARLCRQLATIKLDVPMNITDDEMKVREDPRRENEFYLKYELRSLVRKIDEPVLQTTQKAQRIHDFNPQNFNDRTALFTVYSSPDHEQGLFRGFGLANQKGSWFYPEESFNTAFYAWLLGPTDKTVYDVKELYHLLKKNGDPGIANAYDTMIGAFLADNTVTSYDLLLARYDGPTSQNPVDIYGKPGKETIVDEQKEDAYAGDNADFLYRIEPLIRQNLENHKQSHLYTDVEAPLAYVLYLMEDAGIRVNTETLDEIADKTYQKVQLYQQEIWQEAGEQFNINSPKMLSEILYDKLGLPSKGKKKSTAADVLSKMSGLHPIVEHVLDYRKYQKFYSTYADGLKKYIQPDGKIHTHFNQCLVSTGRLSSSEPNLQNITVRDEETKEIRKAFVAEPGCVIMSADYAQIELRILAHMADEPALIETFREGIDVHTRTAMDIFHVKREDVTPEMRRKGKTVNFGIVYGISDYGLADRLGISRQEAGDYIRKYYESYPHIKKFLDDTVQFCREHGYVETLLHRRREIPEIHDKSFQKREFGERAAMNAPVQGTAADLIKIAMIKIQNAMKQQGMKSRMIIQVHDELVFNVPQEEIEPMSHIIQDGMEHAMTLKVPLSAQTVYGPTWYEAKG